MVASDDRKRWPADLLDDPRVVHYWDEERAVGRWFAGKPELGECTLGGDIAWDAYFLFPATAKWEAIPAPLTVSGCPIVRTRERLDEAVGQLPRRPGAAGS